jgi:5-formyltetrahydrofolate cyclo-ligase
VQSLFGLAEYQDARAISVFLSMPAGEINTIDIIHDAFRQGKKVFVPYTYRLGTQREAWPPSIMDMVQLDSIEDFTSLKPDKWGIPTPSRDSVEKRQNCFGGRGKTEGQTAKEAADAELDLIIMPGLAFDRGLERLGHGKGYYDLFLQRYLWHSQKAKTKMPFVSEYKTFVFSMNSLGTAGWFG